MELHCSVSHDVSCAVHLYQPKILMLKWTIWIHSSDQTHGLHCSSSRQQLSEDQTQRHWMTGRTKCSIGSFPERFQSSANVTRCVRSTVTGLSLHPINARAPMIETTECVWSGQKPCLVSSRKVGFVPNGYFLSGAYK